MPAFQWPSGVNLDQLEGDLKTAGHDTRTGMVSDGDGAPIFFLEADGTKVALSTAQRALVRAHVPQRPIDPRGAKIDGMSLSAADKTVLKDLLGVE